MYSVLLADDSTFLRAWLRRLINNEIFQVTGEAKNGKEAFMSYKENKPDIVFMDITMPIMDGIEALKKIKEYDLDARIVMVSSLGQQSIILDCLRLGAMDFVVKPHFQHIQSILNNVAIVPSSNDKKEVAR
ncbi:MULTISPECIES: response regulator [unclassified Bacillus (in: firmicutes)]|uniref:response regulator n=1 Tax=unclassified Bacillus (in: firmicutes) TaxID=185979 RepID=UPI001BE7ACA7|nr:MULTISPECIES: response regulator [unclassified Bacillus (in: firmicutes)]MBT2637018.1 response regulator [Bacillus sp. ISL-39]MBT2660093.1 response regulator [Bacillus sp. ISL-45]